jgi:hypothetical protein
MAALCWDGFGRPVGALIATFVGRNAVVYALGTFVCGVQASVVRIGIVAIALRVVVLILRERPPWIAAWHRSGSLARHRAGADRDAGLVHQENSLLI